MKNHNEDLRMTKKLEAFAKECPATGTEARAVLTWLENRVISMEIVGLEPSTFEPGKEGVSILDLVLNCIREVL